MDFELKDILNSTTPPLKGKVTANAGNVGLCISFEGYGDHSVGLHPVYIEVQDGKLVVILYRNVNNEAPTDIISLEECRSSRVIADDCLTLTVPVVKRYLKAREAACPYCDSQDLEMSPIEFENSGTGLNQELSCNDCGRKWTDVYALSKIEENEDSLANARDACSECLAPKSRCLCVSPLST